MQTFHHMGVSWKLLSRGKRKLVMAALGCWPWTGGTRFSGVTGETPSGFVPELKSKEKERGEQYNSKSPKLRSWGTYGVDVE